MPTITITDEQARALGRGEDVTIAAPAGQQLHNVLLLGHGRQIYFIWDGYIQPDGRLFTTRHQRLVDSFGNAANSDVEISPAEKPCYLSGGALRRKIIQVGA